jgi:methylated-DNA-protein-cysteine methyltransferase-like protein
LPYDVWLVQMQNNRSRQGKPLERHPMSRTYERFYLIIRRIPRGRVATYGQVAALAGMPGRARQVGYALNTLSTDSDLPWQRVVNSAGRVSPRSDPGADHLQRILLEAEGVAFDELGRIALKESQWKPRRRLPRRKTKR